MARDNDAVLPALPLPPAPWEDLPVSLPQAVEEGFKGDTAMDVQKEKDQ